ncbi:MAG TPA: hypothetical protein VIF57_10085 [Polyangia bacterium]|jgi:hypothetical protein
MATPASITTWHRLIPISRSADFGTALAAEVHDPMWMLARQHQIGELRGEDTGSPAFVRVGYKAAPLVDLVLTNPTGDVTVSFDANKPIEAQILPEPFAPDLATKVEIGLTFFQILHEAITDQDRADEIQAKFLTVTTSPLKLPAAAPANFDPIDDSTNAFMSIALGRTLDGVALYPLAQARTIPSEVSSIMPALTVDEVTAIGGAYDAFVRWVDATFGKIGTTDPDGWNPQTLDYDVKLRFGGPTATVTLDVHPNENGSVDWTSFDKEATTNDPFMPLDIQVAREIPTHVRFPGMPAPRYWDFESGELPWPDVDAMKTELARLLVIDFAMLYSIDMFVVPLDLAVSNAVAIDSVVVYDVFGGRIGIDAVEAGRAAQVPDRFTMYSTAAPTGAVAGFMVVPPGAGRALQHGPVLEEVRFARDEVANMVWGIEAVTQSRIGERRRGSERDAAVDATLKAPDPLPPTDAPLRYQIESSVPVHWIPFLPPASDPVTTLEKAVIVRASESQLLQIPAAGKILNPSTLAKYTVFEERVSRPGARVERLVFGARSQDGKSYVWTARRRRAGVGETQSGLRFDGAVSTET